MALTMLLLACASEETLRHRVEAGAQQVDALEAVPEFPPWYDLEVPVPENASDTGTPVQSDYDESVIYDDTVVHAFDIELDDDALDALRSSPDVDVQGQLLADDEPNPYPIAVRLKGTSSYRPLDSKPAFKLDFHAIDYDGRFHGAKRLNLNNMVQDSTMMHEYAYYWLCNELGVPSPRQGYAWVTLNGEDIGLYSIVENEDEQFIRRFWRDDPTGVLWSAVGGDFSYDHDGWFLEEGIDQGELAAMTDTVQATPPESFLDMLEDHFDVDALMGYFAMDIVAGNPDGYAWNINNFDVYNAPIADRWTVLPNGVDRSFTDVRGIPGPGADPRQGALLTGCLREETCKDMLVDRISETLDACDTLDFRGHVAEKLAVVAPLCTADPRRDRLCRADEILGEIDMRLSTIRSDLGRRQ